MKLLLRWKTIFGSVLLIVMIFAASYVPETPWSAVTEAKSVAGSSAVAGDGQTAATEPFDTLMSVLTHPRCINCHPSDDQPRQRDDQIVHLFNVTRGKDNHGGPVQTCETCHHAENNLYSNVPGAPHWGLAPRSMGWLGLTEREIAQALIDPEKNGGRTFDDLLHHMSEDPLVLWAWAPGAGRTAPPVSHDEFVKALEAWLETGAPLPAE